MHALPGQQSVSRIACVVDLDNVLARRGKFKKYARAQLDICKFRATLKARGITSGVVFQNRRLSVFESKIWNCLGIEAVSTRTNVDNAVKIQAIDFALEGVDTLVMCVSDGGYCGVIRAIRECGVVVEVWSLREAASRELVFASDRLVWMDYMVVEPFPPDVKVSGHVTRSKAVKAVSRDIAA